MQSLAARSRNRRRYLPLAAAAVVVLAATGIGTAIALRARGSAAGSGATRRQEGSATTLPGHSGRTGGFSVASFTPQAGSTGVASDATLSVRFSSPLAADGPEPVLDPPVAGSWKRASPTTLVFDAAAPLIPAASESITVRGGPSGVRDASGAHLARSASVSFTVAGGSTHRLQELLAQLGYLPLAYVPPSPAPPPRDLAESQPGSLTWRWQMPASLTSLWVTGSPNVITKAAVMSFERQNGLTTDGIAGPQVWKALLADVSDGKGDATPYVYVYVSKTPLPEALTLYDDGAVKFGGILVNTGAPGATTQDGTYPVFEHVVASDMKGTNITGSTYNDPTVPWASYFNGGDALHGFPRAHYGYPQSNGCVEMAISDAAMVWPYTPVGTLVTVAGLPNTPPQSPPTTTTTEPTTTTTAAPPAPTAATTTTATPPG